MQNSSLQTFSGKPWVLWLFVLLVLGIAAYLGLHAKAGWILLILAVIGGLLITLQPLFGVFMVPVAALLAHPQIGTGTEVSLNYVTLLVPAVLAIWVLSNISKQRVQFAKSRTTLPLLLLLGAGLLSLLIGNVIWDPFVPRGSGFLLVQVAQWAIFLIAVSAFWLTANVINDELWLRRLTFTFVAIGGALAVFYVIPQTRGLVNSLATLAIIRTPFWILLAGLSGGQLLFDRQLGPPVRAILIVIFLATVAYGFSIQRDSASNWVGLALVIGVLTWLRFPRLRWLILVILVAATVVGILFPFVWQFAGGENEWVVSGGSRLVLQQRVIEETMRNPLTGLGPAAYRLYAGTRPLRYEAAYWITPRISSHNNYVDIFSHFGLVGLLLFFWFAFELARVALRLRRRYPSGFLGGYLNGMLAVGVASLGIMVLADWILPFVYNIGFPGFQASVLVWLFLGGLVAIENLPQASDGE